MPRSLEANQQIREERRGQILEVAARVFARKGLTDTRIADIAAESQMSQGLIYRYFAGKDELFAVLVEGTFGIMLNLAQQAMLQPGTPWDRLYWLTAQILPFQYEKPEGALVLIHAVVNESVPAPVRAMARQYSQAVQAIVRDLIAAGQQAGQVGPGDPVQLMVLYLASLQGLAAATGFLDQPASALPDIDTVLRFLRP